ncbi:hypothetical protein BDA99DRAFT_537754 [Phascolomyces articulosus]|uniref:Heterokaryon incompatibility domain-containing protein n=1 Tax=Phascolomyces articulosus TaxID=60185 RepID=A0AAD5K022_9FUNG|nr:hypothetical protein BDA99DRAFT_537754 [Phascolomyces articulosus]
MCIVRENQYSNLSIIIIIILYITYCRNQTTVDLVDTTSHCLNASGGNYRPNLLVRVSDWKTVPGTEAKDGYCALSYCWDQSGEVVERDDGSGEYDCIDNSKHCIVDGCNVDKDLLVLSDKEKRDGHVIRCKPVCETTTVKDVSYNELLQQLCKDFQIHYLWYDKLCIDQSNREIKLKEIKQMHRIYSNALYTIALVPEVHINEPEDFDEYNPHCGTKALFYANENMMRSHWYKRSWTLEEVMRSKYILVVANDLSILHFGLNVAPDGTPTVMNTVRNYNLPSWCGIYGRHTHNFVVPTTSNRLINSPHIVDATMRMHIKTNYYWRISPTLCKLGPFSSEIPDENIASEQYERILIERRNGQWKSMTVDKDTILMEWFVTMKAMLGYFVTHYHQHEENSSPTKIRPLSLTECCVECFVLPILLNAYIPVHKVPDGQPVTTTIGIISQYIYSYCLPVFKKCTENNDTDKQCYKAIGVYMLGFGLDIEGAKNSWCHCVGKERAYTGNQEEILQTLFEDYHHDGDIKEFIIE